MPLIETFTTLKQKKIEEKCKICFKFKETHKKKNV